MFGPWFRSAVVCTAWWAFGGPGVLRPNGLSVVQANDNRTPAGRMDGDTLRLSLVVEMARWYPGAEDGASAVVAALSEEGERPAIPGPLIRVPEGTVIDVSLRNGLPDSTVRLIGLMTRPAAADSEVMLAPGAMARMSPRGSSSTGNRRPGPSNCARGLRTGSAS
jgi:FtsP/CotA-like multicopper oxidase with cupredoxin domain